MNPMLKIAYDYGRQRALQDMEKQAAVTDLVIRGVGNAGNAARTVSKWKPIRDAYKSMGALGKFNFRNPYTLGSALTGGLSGGIAGAANAEDGYGLRGFLSGALGGAALGGLTGHFGSKALMGKKDFKLGKRYSQGAQIMNQTTDPVAKKLMQQQLAQAMQANPISGGALAKQIAGTGAAGVVGGLGAGYLAGANEKPWYQRMNPFA